MATLEELALVGYGALRVEDVAARAAVNKTTVYRRWPEKVALVRDAFACMAAAKFCSPGDGQPTQRFVSVWSRLGRGIDLAKRAESSSDAGG